MGFFDNVKKGFNKLGEYEKKRQADALKRAKTNTALLNAQIKEQRSKNQLSKLRTEGGSGFGGGFGSPFAPTPGMFGNPSEKKPAVPGKKRRSKSKAKKSYNLVLRY